MSSYITVSKSQTCNRKSVVLQIQTAKDPFSPRYHSAGNSKADYGGKDNRKISF